MGVMYATIYGGEAKHGMSMEGQFTVDGKPRLFGTMYKVVCGDGIETTYHTVGDTEAAWKEIQWSRGWGVAQLERYRLEGAHYTDAEKDYDTLS